MLTAVGLTFAALWIPGLAVLINALRRAPVGYEDATGFHVTEAVRLNESVIAATVRAS